MGNNSHSRILGNFADSGQQFTQETIATEDGHLLTIFFIKHATLCFVWDGMTVCVDPLSEYADFSALPKADLILVTHEHSDHFDKNAIKAASDDNTMVVGSRNVTAQYSVAKSMSPGERLEITDGVSVEAVSAYNVSSHQLQFHPKERGDNGYILSLGKLRVYVSGDTEPTPEMESFGKIDVMFLPVNQPYTMTLEQAATAARTIGAPVFYPYHTGDTKIMRLKQMLANTPAISVRIHPME